MQLQRSYTLKSNLWRLSIKTSTNLVKFTSKNMHNQKPTNLKSKLISKHQTNLKKIPFSILQHRVGPMLSSSVFYNTNTHLLKIFYSNISVLPLSGKYCNFV